MSQPRQMTRRSALGTAAAVATVSGLAAVSGCTLGGSPDPTPSASGSGPGDGAGTALVALDQVPVGGVAAVTIDRKPAFVARPDTDEVRAFSAICTHRGCTVLARSDLLLCPCHGSHFDLLTGDVLRGPATKALPPIPVHLEGNQVVQG